MRVLMVTGDLNTSGAEMMAFDLAVALRRRGVDVAVIALRSRGDMGRRYEKAGIDLFAGLLKFRYDLLAAVRIARIIRQREIDVLIAVDVLRNAMFLGLGAVSLSGRPVRRVLWSHTTPTGWVGDFTGGIRRYLKLGMLDEIVCISKLQQRQFTERGIPPEIIRRIYNGIDPDRYADVSPASLPEAAADKTVLLQVANVLPHKDFDTLLAAAKILADRKVNCCILLAGRGTDSAGFHSKIESLGLEDMVLPLGLRHDVPELLAACDAMILSSHDEVFNVSVLEAMAAGRAILASDVQGLEMFDDGQEGIKVPPQNPQAFAAAVERLCGEADLRERLGRAGRQRAEEFSLERMADEFLKLLQDAPPA
ncbi:MAG: glycosyltransferase [Phycisphaerae bacterium]|nr:glycosyltransferase [Phycisphaerae bacterium]